MGEEVPLVDELRMAETWAQRPGGMITLPAGSNVFKRAADRIEEIETELNELQALFDKQWERQIGAIKQWQEATGKHLTHPDHGDLMMWLLEKLEAKEAQLTWIDVKERFPDDEGIYLTIVDGEVDLQNYGYLEESDRYEFDCDEFATTTHWLPIPPKEKG